MACGGLHDKLMGRDRSSTPKKMCHKLSNGADRGTSSSTRAICRQIFSLVCRQIYSPNKIATVAHEYKSIWGGSNKVSRPTARCHQTSQDAANSPPKITTISALIKNTSVWSL